MIPHDRCALAPKQFHYGRSSDFPRFDVLPIPTSRDSGLWIDQISKWDYSSGNCFGFSPNSLLMPHSRMLISNH